LLICLATGYYVTCREAAEALKACAALEKTPITTVFLGPFGTSRRS
jgi:hypothetical protein